MLKKLFTVAAASALAVQSLPSVTSYAADASSKGVDALQYTYEIYPLMAPFNEYFFVKTDNPNPESFRFSDKDSPYSETSVIYNDDSSYADVEYEDTKMHRVNGGYIFKSFTTNGGELTLQVHEEITRAEFNTAIYGTPNPEFTGYSPYHGMPVGSYDKHYEGSSSYSIVGYYKWVDTDIKFDLPELCDDCDYLINKYSSGEDFFANMDAVQSGFSKDCLYSGSYIRGEIYRSSDKEWRLYTSPHVDQIFYIYSPYSRKDNKSLFASALYPFRYDSLGFPGMMGKISKRLNADSSYEWSSSSHAHIQVTYNGETKTYGGAGNGEGQGISEDKLTHVFTFGDNDESITLSDARAILDEYAAVEMSDDIPREGQLTWKDIYDTVGDGAWVDMGGGRYDYLYQRDDKASFSCEEWGVGHNIYWGGSLGYGSDMWIDGRYVSKYESMVKGATFADHPQSAILLPETVVPEIVSYERKWDSSTGKYIYTSTEIAEKTVKNVVYRYDSTDQLWKANINWGEYGNSMSTFKTLTDTGIIDEKYYDMLTLTQDEAEAIVNNGKSSAAPESGFIFDGTAPNGTPFMRGDVNDDGYVNIADVVTLQKYLLASGQLANVHNANLCEDKLIDSFDLALLRKMLIEKI